VRRRSLRFPERVRAGRSTGDAVPRGREPQPTDPHPLPRGFSASPPQPRRGRRRDAETPDRQDTRSSPPARGRSEPAREPGERVPDGDALLRRVAGWRRAPPATPNLPAPPPGGTSGPPETC